MIESPRFAGTGARTPLGVAVNLASLGLLVWGAAAEAHLGLADRHLAALIALVVAAGAWIVWTLTGFSVPTHQTRLPLAAMGLAGGVLTAFAPLGLVFVGVAALGATIAWDPSDAVWVALSGPASLAVTLAAAGESSARLGAGAAAVVAGAAMGISRRQSLLATRQEAETRVAEARADAEAARAELLAGRNHLARELHDVLAHTLSALSLHLEALDSVIARGGDPDPDVRERLDVAKRLRRRSPTSSSTPPAPPRPSAWRSATGQRIEPRDQGPAVRRRGDGEDTRQPDLRQDPQPRPRPGDRVRAPPRARLTAARLMGLGPYPAEHRLSSPERCGFGGSLGPGRAIDTIIQVPREG